VASARARVRMGTALILCAAFVVTIPFLVRAVAPARAVGDDSSVLVEHQLQGLASPLDNRASTLGVHFRSLVSGVQSVTSEPFGVGISAVSLAGSRFGGKTRPTEADPSNAAVALGLPGLLAYIAVLVLGFTRAYSLARRRRDALSLIALGILAVTGLQWLNGGQYAVAYLPWLLLGWLDRRSSEGGNGWTRPQ
jgi:hypothetical protein